MPTDVSIRFRADGKQARQQITALEKEIDGLQRSTRRTSKEALEFRKELQRLDSVNAELRQRIVTADAAERKRIQAFIHANNTAKALIQTELQRLSIQKQSVSLQAQETRALLKTERALSRAEKGTGRFSGALGTLGGTLGAIGIDTFIYRLTEFVRGSARAAIEIDGASRALTVLTGSAAEAAAQLQRVQDLADEPGLQFQSAVQGTVALRAIGVEAETTTRILQELANAAAFSGGGSGEFERGLLGFRQLIQRGRLSQEELNQLTENIGLASKVLKEEFGTVLAEDIQAELDATGQSVNDFVERVLTGFERLERFPLDAPAVKLKNLGNSFFEFQAAVGDKFLPVIAGGAEVLTKFFDGFTEFISVTDTAAQSVENFTTAILEADTAIGREDAIENRIRFLREYIAELQEAERNRGIFDRRGRSQVQGQIAGEQAELGRLQQIEAGDPEIIQSLTAEVEALNTQLAALQQTQTDLENTASRYSENQQRRFDRRRQNLDAEEDEIVKQLELRESELLSAREAAAGIAEAEREKIQASEEATAAADAAAAATKAQTDALIAHIHATRETRENLDSLSEGQEVLNTFWQVARGDVEAYTDAVNLASGSITNHAAEMKAFQEIFKDTQDPFETYIDEYGTLSRAIEKVSQDTREYAISQELATAQAKLVNPAVTEAASSIRDYAKELSSANLSSEALAEITSGSSDRIRAYAQETLTAEGVINNFQSAIDDVEERYVSLEATSDRLTTKIREQASAFDKLRSSVGGVSAAASGLQGQQLGSGIFDQFDARTPGTDTGASFGDTLKAQSLQLGTELVSQGIRTAGGLKRIEEDRVASLEELEAQYSEKILAINAEKARKLAEIEERIEAEHLKRIAAIQEAFETAADAEVEARARAAERISAIEARAAERRETLRERLNERLIALEERQDDRIQDLEDGFIEREAERQAERLEITETATKARIAAEQRYTDTVQEINNTLVEDVRAVQARLAADLEEISDDYVSREAERAAEIAELTEKAAAERTAANETYADTMQDIYNTLVEEWDALEDGFTERQAERAEERIQIEKEAIDARIEANKEYEETVEGINRDLVDEILDIEAEITEVSEDAAKERIEIEKDALEARKEANEDYKEKIALIDEKRNTALANLTKEDQEKREHADQEYADTYEAIQRDLVDKVVSIQEDLAEKTADIQEDLNDTLKDLRDEALDAEQERADSLVELHEATQKKIEDIERKGKQTEEDIHREFRRDQEDAYIQLERDLEEADSNEDREKAEKKYNQKIQDLTREYFRDIQDLRLRQARQREALARQTAAQEIEIARKAAEEQERIEREKAEARAKARTDTATAQTEADTATTAAETEAGSTFEKAQAEYVPALNKHEAAIAKHTAALNKIDQTTIEKGREILSKHLEDTATATKDLNQTLKDINATEQAKLKQNQTETTKTLTDLEADKTAAEQRAGITFEEALKNYTPAVDLNTKALNTLNETLSKIDTDTQTATDQVTQAGITDREQTTGKQTDLETKAGVSIEDARENYVPALSAATTATNTLNDSIKALDTAFREETGKIYAEGLIDKAKIDEAVRIATQNARTTITGLETDAGTTFAAAQAAFVPNPDALTQAGIDRDTAITGINQEETAGIDDMNAQRTADRLETDAEITATRDAYIHARDTLILQHNTAILALNTKEVEDLNSINTTLKTDLLKIDTTLQDQLDEIRDQKRAFDTAINKQIEAINAAAELDFRILKEDTAAMRIDLDAIAAEARNNQWKQVLAGGLQVTATIAGAAIGGPAGAAVGGAVGQLAAQGVNELFHFEQTDAIARKIAKTYGLRQPEQQPRNYFPTRTQLENAEDVSRAIVEGLSQAATQNTSGQNGIKNNGQSEMKADINLVFTDGNLITYRDQTVSLEDLGL